MTYSAPGNDAAAPSLESLRMEARFTYGADAAHYGAGRPDYPGAVYAILGERCGLGQATRVLEIGPGHGVASRHFTAVGAEVTAIEPDEGFVAYLGRTQPSLSVINKTFEDADLAPSSFDLVAAATSFHWLDQAGALRKVGRVLRPAGWLAVWWTVFSDPTRPDPLIEEASGLLGFEPGNQRAGSAFQLDETARVRDFRELGGLRNVRADRVHWELGLNARQTRDLFSTQIAIRRLDDPARERVLGLLAGLVGARRNGTDRRPLITALYTGQK